MLHDNYESGIFAIVNDSTPTPQKNNLMKCSVVHMQREKHQKRKEKQQNKKQEHVYYRDK